MNVLSTFGFVLAHSAKNRVVAQVKRLKQPRYLIATLVGVAYWWLYIGRNLFGGERLGRVPVAWTGVGEAIATALGLFLVTSVWAFGSTTAKLTFSTAEVQFFFPAPTTRRMLLHYKLLSSLLLSFLGAAFASLFLGRSIGGNFAIFTIGFWLATSTLSFHSIAAQRTRQDLAENAALGLARKLPTLAVLLTIASALGWALYTVGRPPPFMPTLEWFQGVVKVTEVAPLSWILLPIRVFTHTLFAPDGKTFFTWLPAAVGVLGLHYAWIVAGDTAFEESSVAASEARAKLVDARRQGGRRPVTYVKRKPPFRLSGTGPPEVALVWKSLIASGRVANTRALAIGLVAFGGVALVAWAVEGVGAAFSVLGSFALMFWAMATFAGAAFSRGDLRANLEHLEILRSLPIAGRRIVLAEAVGAWVPVVYLQWVSLALGLLLVHGDPVPHVTLWQRVCIGLAAALAGPMFTFAGLLVQNAVVVVVPAWASAGKDNPQGFEASGMRFILLLANLLLVTTGLIPVAVVSGLVGLAFWPLLEFGALPIAALVAAVAGGFEMWLVSAWLGRLFDRYEASA